MRADSAPPEPLLSPPRAAPLVASDRGEPASAAPALAENVAPRPLSSVQEWIWALQRAHPDSTLFHLPLAVQIRGPLRERRLERALARLLKRHAALRTMVVDSGGQAATIVHESVPLTAPVVATEREPRSGGAALAKLDYHLREEVRRPFDLATEPPLRVRLFQIDPTDHVLLITLHQLAADERSAAILLQELERLYHGLAAREPVVLPKLVHQYPDVTAWQGRWLASERGAEHLAYWTGHLGDLDPVRLPASGPPGTVRGTRAARVERVVPAATRDRLAHLSRQAETTLKVSLLTGLAALLAVGTGRDDIAVGLRVPGRVQPGTDLIVGPLANTVVVRADLSGNPSFRESARRVHQRVVEARRHQLVPLPRILAELHPEQPPRLDPWCPVTFALTTPQAPVPPPAAAEVTFERIAVPVEETVDEISVTIVDQGAGLLVTVVYAADLFNEDAMTALLDRFVALLGRVAVDPEQGPWPGIDSTGGAGAVRRPGADARARPRPAVRPLRPALVPLLSGPDRRPIYVVPGGSGSANMLVATAGIVRRLALGRPMFAYLATEPIAAGDGHAWVEATAANHVHELRACQPDGPYLLLGACVGGILAMAMASQLAESGLRPPHVVLLDTRHPALGLLPPSEVWRDLTVPPPVRRHRALQVGTPAADPMLTGEDAEPGDDPQRYFERVLSCPRILRLKDYRPRPYPGEVTLLANQGWLDRQPALGWAPPAVARLHLHPLPGDHEGLQDNLELIGAILRPLLDDIEATADTGSAGSIERPIGRPF